MIAKRVDIGLISISLLGYILIAQTARHETVLLLGLFAVLFMVYGWLITKTTEIDLWIYAAILFRVIFLFFLPQLSDDFYRFIWDGRLLAAGYHPFSHIPSYYMEHQQNIPGITSALFEKLNSPEYFTIYPSVNQFIFWLGAKLFPDSIFGSLTVMRCFLLSAEIGTIYVIRKLLTHYQLPARNVLIYAINPLVIVELTGNVHFEALMIFFVIVSFWYLVKSKIVSSAISISFAIATKLLPLIILPLFISWLGWRKSLLYFLLVGAVSILLFLPLINAEFIHSLSESVGYYFQKFEFNASIYYLVREYGFWKYGYNIIQTAGWKLAVCCTLLIVSYSLLVNKIKNQFGGSLANATAWTSVLLVFVIYQLLATTVHPWYITPLIAFSAFSPWRFSLIWSCMVLLTYAGYYSGGFQENYYLTTLEYVSVLVVFGVEWYQFTTRSKESIEVIST